jgi:hypothetical protein
MAASLVSMRWWPVYGSLAAGWVAFLPALYALDDNGDRIRQILLSHENINLGVARNEE